MRSSECINEYTQFLSDIRHKSKNTIEAYHRDVVKYAEFVTRNYGVDIDEATEPMASAYLVALRDSGKSDATVSRVVASLRSFRLFLSGDSAGRMAFSKPKREKKLPCVLTHPEIERLLAAPPIHTDKGIRDKAMLELLYATGIRVSELIGMDISDIDVVAGFIICRGTRHDRLIPLGRSAADAAANYIDTVRDRMAHADEKALFVNTKGGRMSRQGFWKIIKHYGEMSGIRRDITPHTLRHSFAAHLVQNGADLESLREMMGHATIASTQIYSLIPSEHIRDVYDRAHPRA